MSYPRNNASPERIAVGAVVQISDGAVQTSGVSVSVRGQGGASGAAAGTIAYDNGIVQYTPTQGETDYTSFVVVAYKAGCIPASVTVVTSASGTPGVAVVPDTQKVDLNTIKTQTVTCAAGVTVPSSIASPTNITAASGVTISGTLTTIDAVWTELKRWLRILVRADSSIAADYSDVLTSINANTGTGTGVYDNTASALHALHTHLADIENGTNDPLVSTSGTATAGGASTITLAVGTAGGTDYYVRQAVMLTGGTGAGQTNRITAYNSGTRVATVADAWVTQPDNTTTYKVLGRTE